MGNKFTIAELKSPWFRFVMLIKFTFKIGLHYRHANNTTIIFFRSVIPGSYNLDWNSSLQYRRTFELQHFIMTWKIIRIYPFKIISFTTNKFLKVYKMSHARIYFSDGLSTITLMVEGFVGEQSEMDCEFCVSYHMQFPNCLDFSCLSSGLS